MTSGLRQPRPPTTRNQGSAKAGRGLANALEAVHLQVVPALGNILQAKRARAETRARMVRATVLLAVADEEKEEVRGRAKVRTSNEDQAQTAALHPLTPQNHRPLTLPDHHPLLQGPMVAALDRHGPLVEEKAKVNARGIRRLAALPLAAVKT